MTCVELFPTHKCEPYSRVALETCLTELRHQTPAKALSRVPFRISMYQMPKF